jgi:hypothetical protein
VKAKRIVPVVGEPLDDAELVIIDGKIELIGRDLEYPRGAEVIDARDQVVMPGLLLARSRHGLRSYSRSGVKAHRKASEEVLLEEIDFEPLHEAGFTAVAFLPTGSGLTGQSSLYRTGGPESERLLDDAVHVIVPFTSPARDKVALRNALKKAQAEIDKVEKARAEWEKKQEEEKKKKEAEEKKKEQEQKQGGQGGNKQGGEEKKEEEKPAEFKPPEIDAGHVPFVDLIQEKEGASPMLVELSRASDLVHWEDLLSTRDDALAHELFLDPGFSSDFNYAIERLGARGGLVLTTPGLSRLPSTSTRYNLPAELAVAGLDVAFVPRFDNATEWKRYRARAADLVRAGMPRDAALRALTLHPARLLGVEDRLGSIEKGKDADLVFLDGDGPLDPHAEVTRVMILGETVWEREEDS